MTWTRACAYRSAHSRTLTPQHSRLLTANYSTNRSRYKFFVWYTIESLNRYKTIPKNCASRYRILCAHSFAIRHSIDCNWIKQGNQFNGIFKMEHSQTLPLITDFNSINWYSASISTFQPTKSTAQTFLFEKDEEGNERLLLHRIAQCSKGGSVQWNNQFSSYRYIFFFQILFSCGQMEVQYLYIVFKPTACAQFYHEYHISQLDAWWGKSW